MENKKLEIIQQLMEELEEEMQYSPDDLGSRLGREKKPEIEVMKLESSEDPLSMEEGMDDEMMSESPEEKFKQRLMKLRG